MSGPLADSLRCGAESAIDPDRRGPCATRRFLADNLAADGYEPLEADTAHDALRLMATKSPDLAIIDLGLPDRDGLDLLRESTNDPTQPAAGSIPGLPVIVLTGRARRARSRPRIRARDRRLSRQAVQLSRAARADRGACWRGPAAAEVGQAAGRTLELDPLSRSVELDGEPIHLSKKEFALLRALAEDPTRVFTREELLRGVWGFQSPAATRTLDSHASRLRRKLSGAGGGFVVNVWGVGYRLIDGGSGALVVSSGRCVWRLA